jgi:hypothetical protein
MADMKRMEERICDELDKIAEKGLTSGNLETAYKLIDMYKDIKTVEAMEGSGYSEGMSYDSFADSMAMGGNSNARGRGRYAKRDRRGRYSSEGESMESMNESYRRGRSYADEQYSQAKMDYRNSMAGKQDVMGALEEKMHELREELKEMSKDSDFPEERQKIDKYVNMLNQMM